MQLPQVFFHCLLSIVFKNFHLFASIYALFALERFIRFDEFLASISLNFADILSAFFSYFFTSSGTFLLLGYLLIFKLTKVLIIKCLPHLKLYLFLSNHTPSH